MERRSIICKHWVQKSKRHAGGAILKSKIGWKTRELIYPNFVFQINERVEIGQETQGLKQMEIHAIRHR